MTPETVKFALAAGSQQHALVAALLAEGLSEAAAWTVVRAASVAHLTEQLAGLAAAPVEDEAAFARAEGRRLSLSAALSVEAAELLSNLTAALGAGALSPAHSVG